MEHDEQQPPHFFKDFAHARTLLKKTSRGKNAAWYREAVQLDHQLHLFESTHGFLSFFHNSSSGEIVSLKVLSSENAEEVVPSYFEYLKTEVLPEKSRGLGVILHLNHEASVFEFPRQEWATTHPGKSLRELIAEDPAEVLQDRTLAESTLSFRVFPTPAHPNVEESSCAIAVSSRGEDLLAAFRNMGASEDYPIRTHGLSSPLLLISRLPRTLEGLEENPFCVLLRYEGFSFVAFFQGDGELILLRSIRHQNSALPHNLESILSTTAASIELPSLTIRAFDCRLTKEIALNTELIPLLLSIPFEVESLQRKAAGEENPTEESNDNSDAVRADLPLELRVFRMKDDEPALAFAGTETFGSQIGDGYHLQNFLEVSKQERDAMPGAVDMKLLRIGRVITRVGLAACLLFAISIAFSVFTKMRSDEWKSAKGNQVLAANAAKELRAVRGKEQLLADRSKGWIAMEVLARLFPLDGSFQFNDAKYTVTPILAETGATSVGFTRIWTVNGLARENTTEALMKRNSTEGMGTVFEKAAAATGSSSLGLSEKTRNLLVDLNFSDNEKYDPAVSNTRTESFAFKFSLTIKQRIEGGDPLAIPVAQL